MPENSHTFPGDHPTEIWTITLLFNAANETRARYIARDVTRRIADALPGYDKNYVAITRDADPGLMLPVYCADDIYCHREPDHAGPCHDDNGRNLDQDDDK